MLANQPWLDDMFKNRNKPYIEWIERNVPELSNRGQIYVERTIRRAENETQPLPSVIRFVGFLAGFYGAQSIADVFFSYREQRLEYNIVLIAVMVVVILITAKVADHLVHRKIRLIADSTE